MLPQGVQHGLRRSLDRVDSPPGEHQLLGHEPNAHRLEEDRGTLLSDGSVVRAVATIATAFAGRVQEILRQDRLLSEIQSETRGRFRHLHRLRFHMGWGAQSVDVGEDARTITYTVVAHSATRKPTVQCDGQFGRGWTLARQHTGRRCHSSTSQEWKHGWYRHGVGTLRYSQQW